MQYILWLWSILTGSWVRQWMTNWMTDRMRLSSIRSIHPVRQHNTNGIVMLIKSFAHSTIRSDCYIFPLVINMCVSFCLLLQVSQTRGFVTAHQTPRLWVGPTDRQTDSGLLSRGGHSLCPVLPRSCTMCLVLIRKGYDMYIPFIRHRVVRMIWWDL